MTDQTTPFLSLPADCISKIISSTSPKDACKAAAVSTAFKSFADSDAVWNRFLPTDLGEIPAAPDSPAPFSTKKELYFLLFESHLLLNGGKMSLKLNKSTGKKTYMLSARELEIAWGDNPAHWGWKSLPESRFPEVAELLSVCWLDIRATLRSQILTPNTIYVAYFVFKLSDDFHGLHGPSLVSLTSGCPAQTEGESETTDKANVYLVPTKHPRSKVRGRLPRLARMGIGGVMARGVSSRRDGWWEFRLGDFFVEEGDKGVVRMQLSETQHLNWKKGLIVEGIEVRPRDRIIFTPSILKL